MDPQFKSLLTSALLAGATAATTWGVSHGWISGADATGVENAIVTLLLAMGGGALAWWESRKQSPKALIQAVNAGDNGVKVVPVEGPGQVVNGPLKEAGK